MSKQQSPRIVLLAMLPLVISLTGIPSSATAGQRSWSVDLHDYSVMEGQAGDGRSHRPIVSLAAANNLVAVALGNPAALAAPNSQANLYRGTWKVNLLMFDANTGKLAFHPLIWPQWSSRSAQHGVFLEASPSTNFETWFSKPKHFMR